MPGRTRAAALSLVLLLASQASAGARALKVNGSTTVNAVVVEAAEALRSERGMSITVDTQGGSTGGIAGVGDGTIDVGMSSRPLNDDDRRRWPKVRFVETSIGADAVALAVSADVYRGGVTKLTKEQVRDLYESRVTSWKALGGPDRRVTFLNKEPGRGTWEVFAHWLYGNPKTAPDVSHSEVGGNEEARSKTESTPGAITQLSASWVEGRPRLGAISIVLPDGSVVPPTGPNVASGRYPLSRSLFIVTNGPPAGDAKVLLDFLLSPRGQDLARKHGYLALADLGGKR